MTAPRLLLAALCATVGALGAVALWSLHTNETPIEATLTVAEVLHSADTAGYRRADKPRRFTFPADHFPHDGFQTEWWYFTGNLQSASGRRFGYQLTFFRRALVPPHETQGNSSNDNISKSKDSSAVQAQAHSWTASHLWMAHFALTDVENKRFYAFERFSREAQGLAGATANDSTGLFKVWLEDWSVSALHGAAGIFPLRLRAAHDSIEISLTLDSFKSASLQGDKGLSQKGAGVGNASYYYSMTRLGTQGFVRVRGEATGKTSDETVSVAGTSWMDREWSTSALGKEHEGWDWFALQLDDSTEVMYYQLRRRSCGGQSATPDSTSKGSITVADGTVRGFGGTIGSNNPATLQLTVLDTWKSPLARAPLRTTYPAQWRLRVPSEQLDLIITPLLPNQELNVSVRYWEGAVRVEGSKRGRRITGTGYVELTGYADKTF